MTTAGHAAAMRACIADSCKQGRERCSRPMTCSGATEQVDASIEGFALHRLQAVEPVRPSVYLAPGVIDKGDTDPPITTPEDCGLLASRAFWIGGVICLAVWSGIAWLVTR